MNATTAQPGSDTPNYVDAYTPPSTMSAAPTSPAANPSTSVSESVQSSGQSETLEDQNIFFLLGVRNGSEAEREKFLDELQQVIWEDFLEYDVKLLITTDEMAELKTMLDSQTMRDLEKQEKIVLFLEKLIPDLEEIMLEKALELKEEMVRERVSGLRQFFADKPEKLPRLDEAEKLMNSGKWYSAAHLMNSLVNP